MYLSLSCHSPQGSLVAFTDWSFHCSSPPLPVSEGLQFQEADNREQVLHGVLNGCPCHHPPAVTLELMDCFGHHGVGIADHMPFIKNNSQPYHVHKRRFFLQNNNTKFAETPSTPIHYKSENKQTTVSVERLLTDTSRKRTPPISGHQTVVPAISLLKLYIILRKRTPL